MDNAGKVQGHMGIAMGIMVDDSRWAGGQLSGGIAAARNGARGVLLTMCRYHVHYLPACVHILTLSDQGLM